MGNSEQLSFVQRFLAEGVLLSPDSLDIIEQHHVEKVKNHSLHRSEMLVVTKDVLDRLAQDISPDLASVNWREFERARALSEKTDDAKVYLAFLGALEQAEGAPLHAASAEGQATTVTPAANPEVGATEIEIVSSYRSESKPWKVVDFVAHYKTRLAALGKILRGRQELENATSIRRLQTAEGNVALIGMVREKQVTKNGNLQMVLEDPTGWVRVLFNKSKQDLFESGKDIVEDDVIGVIGSKKPDGGILFVNEVILPDIPLDKELKKYPGECLVAIVSDIHVGSINFLEEEFKQFLLWIKGEFGTEEQRSLARQIKYLFVLGDLVAGVGVYPGQEKELIVSSLQEQFKQVADYLSQVPERIRIIIFPGNHDGVRLAEPQPAFDKQSALPLFVLKNATFVSNPSLVRILKSEAFPGFDFLLYHGYSFVHFADTVDRLRASGGVDNADEIMKFLLRRRHLAPTHGSSLMLPDPHTDPLLIETVPDFFLSGHLHKSSVGNYRNITMICGSCWEKETSFQKKMGLHPEPARVPIIELHTREVKILRFGSY